MVHEPAACLAGSSSWAMILGLPSHGGLQLPCLSVWRSFVSSALATWVSHIAVILLSAGHIAVILLSAGFACKFEPTGAMFPPCM